MADGPVTESLLEEKRRLVALFGSRAVHDIAGPVDQISSLVALFIRRYQKKIDPDADALLSHIEMARQRLTNTSAGLRKYVQALNTDLTHGPVDLNAVWQSAVASAGKQIAESEAEISSRDLPQVAGDSELLTVLFQALLDNALKFRRKDVRPLIEVSAEPAGDRHLIAISDNGIGIDRAQCEVVFEPFKRLNGHLYPGAGLGLPTAQMIVGLHGGRIRIEPGPSQGARVLVELPV
jgi:light-regulated signal transduction histidine kinase (bacteriophytochrome)